MTEIHCAAFFFVFRKSRKTGPFLISIASTQNFSAPGKWQSPYISPAEIEATSLMSAAGIKTTKQEHFMDVFGLEKCIAQMYNLNAALKEGQKIQNKETWLNKALQKKTVNYGFFEIEEEIPAWA